MWARAQGVQAGQAALVLTQQPQAFHTSEGRACGRARRAYKLGKRRWSYNQCELRFVQEGGAARAEVMEAGQCAAASMSEEQAESGVTYQVRLQRMERWSIEC